MVRASPILKLQEVGREEEERKPAEVFPKKGGKKATTITRSVPEGGGARGKE